MKSAIIGILVGILAALFAIQILGRQAPAIRTGWVPVTQLEMDTTQRARFERAEEARGAMFGSLLGELTSAIEEDGPAHAIGVCAERAPIIAQETGVSHGVRIGRTSAQLRNPKNEIPDLLKEGIELGISGNEQTVFEDGDGGIAVLTPIMLMDQCVQCHGGEDQLGEGVAEALRERYPEDRATGYQPGDLRGWFWVVVEGDG